METGDRANRHPFTVWFLDQAERDGRRDAAIARAARIDHVTLLQLRRGRVPREPTVSKLAVLWGADPDAIGRLANGIHDEQMLDPRGFETLSQWLAETLRARNESQAHASRAGGIRADVCHQIVTDGYTPIPDELRALAVYFRVDFEVLAPLAGYVNLRALVPAADPAVFTSYGAWVAALLRARNESPEHFEETANIERGTLRNSIRYGRRPSLTTVLAVAARIGIDPAPSAALAGYTGQFVVKGREDWRNAARRGEGPPAPYARWLADQVEAFGQPLNLFAKRAGVGWHPIDGALRQISRMSKPHVRKIAEACGADPEEIAAVASDGNVKARCPDPAGYVHSPELERIPALLKGWVEVSGEPSRQLSYRAKLDPGTVDRILSGEILYPHRSTLDKLAGAMRVLPGDVRRLTAARPGFVERGKRLVERMNSGHGQIPPEWVDGDLQVKVQAHTQGREQPKPLAWVDWFAAKGREQIAIDGGYNRGANTKRVRYGAGFYIQLGAHSFRQRGARFTRVQLLFARVGAQVAASSDASLISDFSSGRKRNCGTCGIQSGGATRLLSTRIFG